jgi:hypothetical protein
MAEDGFLDAKDAAATLYESYDAYLSSLLTERDLFYLEVRCCIHVLGVAVGPSACRWRAVLDRRALIDASCTRTRSWRGSSSSSATTPLAKR